MNDTFSLSIDGQDMIGRQGQTVMEVARENGVNIPSMCDSPHLKSFGSCRLCIIEIDGQAGTPSSCTTPALKGMDVHTTSERLWDLRRGITELYVSEHPLDCLTCTANGDCELQDIAGEVVSETLDLTIPLIVKMCLLTGQILSFDLMLASA